MIYLAGERQAVTRDAEAPRGGGQAYTQWAAARQAIRREAVERQLELSELARTTRRPGQSVAARFRELTRGR